MELKKTLNLRNAVMMVVGNVVGAGIFTTSGVLANDVGHPMVFIGVWLIGGLLTLCGALTYAELGAMFPKAGGDYQFLKEAYGPFVGFMVGWLLFLIIMPGSIAALSIAFVHHLPGGPFFQLGTKTMAIGLIAALTLLNVRGARLAGNTQDIVTIGSIVMILLMVGFGFASGRGSSAHFFTPAQSAGGISLSGTALIAVIFTYSGWFASAYIASEIGNPARNVPLSLLTGTAIVSVVYILMNALYLYALPLDQMRGVTDIAALTAKTLFPGFASLLVVGAILLAILSCINATVMTGSRVIYAMARDKLFFDVFQRAHPRYGTPAAALITQAGVAILLVVAGSFEQLLSWVSFAMLLSSTATGAALLVLRYRRPALNRPYRVFGYPFLPLVFIGAYGFIAVSIAVESPLSAVAGLGMLFLGAPLYLVWRNQKGAHQ